MNQSKIWKRIIVIFTLEYCLLPKLTNSFSNPSRTYHDLNHLSKTYTIHPSIQIDPNINQGSIVRFSYIYENDSEPQFTDKEQVMKEVGLTPSKINHLPRLYVGPLPPLSPSSSFFHPSSSIDYINIHDDGTTTTCVLREGTQLPLTPDQCHYITKVLRLWKPNNSNSNSNSKHRKRSNKTQDCFVRIFNGIHGEWLAQIIQEEDDRTPLDANSRGSSSSSSSSSSRKSLARSKQIMLHAVCLTQLRAPSIPLPQTSNNTNSKHTKVSSPIQSPWLFFAPIAKHRCKLLIEKCTELGAGAFHPIITDRTDCDEIQNQSLKKQTNKSKSKYTEPSSSILYQVGGGGGSREETINYNAWISKDIKLDKFFIKLQKIALEASEQSERLTVPPVLPFQMRSDIYVKDTNQMDHEKIWNLKELLVYWSQTMISTETHQDSSSVMHNVANDDTPIEESSFPSSSFRVLLVCRERNAARSLNILQALQYQSNRMTKYHTSDFVVDPIASKAFAFLIGPEGGWSHEEEKMLDHYAKEYPSIIQSVSLSDNEHMILRAETAAILALGAWAMLYG